MTDFNIHLITLGALLLSVILFAWFIYVTWKSFPLEKPYPKLNSPDFGVNNHGEKIEEYLCTDFANRTLALRYGILNQLNHPEYGLAEQGVIYIVKKQQCTTSSGKLVHLIELVSFGEEVYAVLDDEEEVVEEFYPKDDEAWFQCFSHLERVLNTTEAFSLKELAQYYLELVVIPDIKLTTYAH
jgi:hypothetical protein